MSILDPALLGITVKAASFLWEQAAKFRVARDKLEQTELSLDELEKQPARELIQKVLELRAYSLELFQGRSVYETEFTSLLNYLNNGTVVSPKQ